MGSMDHLRDKIRSRKSETGDLNAESNAGMHFDAPPAEPKTGQTDSLISEIFSESESYSHSESAETLFETPQTPEPQPKKANQSLFLHRFKNLEINRKMLMVSLGVAALASILSMSYLKGIAEPLRSKSRLIKVVTVTQDVPARTQLTEKMLDFKEVPADYLAEGALEYKPNMKLLGQVTLTGLYKGEVLHSKRISFSSSETGITTVIPDEHRAITVATNNASLIQPSTTDRKEYVDVLATIPDPNPVRRGKLITIPILQRAMVLAVGNHISVEDSTASAAPSKHITLAVPEKRVSLMVMLGEKANFQVIPRSPGDTSVMTEKYTVQEIEDALQGSFEATPVATAAPETKPVKEEKEEEAEPASAPLVDYSRSTPTRTYRKPVARKPVYRRPAARKPVYRKPVARKPVARKPVVRKAAPPAAAPPRVFKAPVVINGGNCTSGC